MEIGIAVFRGAYIFGHDFGIALAKSPSDERYHSLTVGVG
jgi:hypothetical protein